MDIGQVSAEISTTLSTQIIITSQHTGGAYYPVGAIKSFNVVQNRNIINEIQDDGSVALSPGQTEIIINVERTIFDCLSLPEAFGCGFIHIQSQRFPFNIQVISTDILNGKTFGVTTTYHNCWFSNMSTPIKADNYMIVEHATIWCEFITAERF